jgi:hypothetical protein
MHRLHLQTAFICLFLWALACAPGRPSQEKAFPTNLELLCSAVVECIRHAGDSLSLDPALFRAPERTDSAASLVLFVDHCISEALAGRGWRIQQEGGDAVLDWLPLRASVRYTGFSQKAPWRAGWIGRKASVSILFRMEQGGRSRAIGCFSAEKEDAIPRYALYSAEQNGLLIGRPPLPGMKGFMGWMEPLMAFVLAGTLGYLFYSIRSRS